MDEKQHFNLMIRMESEVEARILRSVVEMVRGMREQCCEGRNYIYNKTQLTEGLQCYLH